MVLDRESAAKRAEAATTNVPDTCQKWTRTMFLAPSAGDQDKDGDADAVDGWLSEPTKFTDRKPPRGTPVAWSGGSSGNGHRAMSLGPINGVYMIRSTDAGGRGKVATVPLGWVEDHWGLKYLGWSPTIDGLLIPEQPGVVTPPNTPAPSSPVVKENTMNRLPANTDVILRSHGLKVVKTDGAELRGRPASTGTFAPVGVLCHHTASKKTSSNASVISLLIKGRSDLPGPLCHFGLQRDGTVVWVASGRANHAGKAKAHGSVGAGDGNSLYIGIEAFNDGVGEPWNAVQYNAYVLLVAVICKELTGNSVNTVSGHKETSVTGKIDPTFDMAKFRTAVSAKLAELEGSNPAPSPTPAPAKKSVATLAKEVMAGKWGNGPARIKKLTAAGYDAKAVQAAVDKVKKKAPAKPVKKPAPKPTKKPTAPAKEPAKATYDFKVHLVPGNKIQTMKSIIADMGKIRKMTDPARAVVFNTERESFTARLGVSRGLGASFTRVIENENTIAYGAEWEKAGSPSKLLLAKEDPGMEGVSPYRYLDKVPLKTSALGDVVINMDGTHLLSEANCIHTKVKGRAWREKMWPIQVADVIADVAADHKAGIPVVLCGDFNTGVFFTGKQLFAQLQAKFGDKAVHVHNGGLDHIFLISTDQVKLSERGVELVTNNASDHDMVSATIRAELF